ncbi:MAG: hypothetical protein OXB89_05070 [Anaerolineaceae bacterium]|nr:hypothetical protein [Anaerolineaceae bacterium]
MGIDKRLLETIEANGRQELSKEEQRQQDMEWREFLAEVRKRPSLLKRRRRIRLRLPFVIEDEWV